MLPVSVVLLSPYTSTEIVQSSVSIALAAVNRIEHTAFFLSAQKRLIPRAPSAPPERNAMHHKDNIIQDKLYITPSRGKNILFTKLQATRRVHQYEEKNCPVLFEYESSLEYDSRLQALTFSTRRMRCCSLLSSLAASAAYQLVMKEVRMDPMMAAQKWIVIDFGRLNFFSRRRKFILW